MAIIKKKLPVVYYEAHETHDLDKIYQLLQPLPYRLYWVPVRNFNKNNFNGETKNIFGDSMLHSIVAWPDNLPELDLQLVQGPDDTLEKLYTRQGINYTR